MLLRMRPYAFLKAEMVLGAAGECSMSHWLVLPLLLLTEGGDVYTSILLRLAVTCVPCVEAACAPRGSPSCITSSLIMARGKQLYQINLERGRKKALAACQS
jgi:hypothetical protein